MFAEHRHEADQRPDHAERRRVLRPTASSRPLPNLVSVTMHVLEVGRP